jgi:hypothetical protein
MADSIFIPREDVERLTGRKKFTAQRRALDRLGIRYVKAADGEPLVRVETLDPSPPKERRRTEPNWALFEEQRVALEARRARRKK